MNGRPPPDDDRTRMAANLGAAVAIMIVLGLGYWLMGAMMRQSEDEDCLMAHRLSCGSIETPRS
ncbi:hypothetical protein [Azospirillum picis]|uniref:Ribulose 1,5-bisphosphate carboxylase large subunit-like protein n=1 Tax=Azospirillum picis TaxID=488438 RepID=A0ABU0MTV8_9PROT|nr:hypothetical protein [Azospirillum picis]MBP2303171.1 ribulose 1,5-bisphosphate carboxylase large subunit-like protein [Azospirillum picis]MDQ0536923.1 ribulose 1,5-bisphosphate carboxylase large subunit-like protein [Azospirillum picis]